MPPASLTHETYALTVAEVSRGNLRHNIRVLQHHAGGAPLMGVIKANAYGHGAIPTATVLRQEGVRHFAVATVPEALQLRAGGFDEPILVFAAPLSHTLPAYAQHGLDATVTSLAGTDDVIAAAHSGGPIRVHVKVDTGMGRLGLAPADFPAAVARLQAAPGVTVAGLWTHFAAASSDAPFTARQWQRFEEALQHVDQQEAVVHAASSSAVFTVPASLAQYRPVLARTGIGLYGVAAIMDQWCDLRPVMRLCARVVHLKTVEAGTPISYGGTWTAPQRTRIATVGAGYADGYPRLLSNRAHVGIGGVAYPVVGTICMDMFMVDLGPAPPPGTDGVAGKVAVGDEVVLFGPGGPTAQQVATWAETIPYEICCRVTARVPRRYVP